LNELDQSVIDNDQGETLVDDRLQRSATVESRRSQKKAQILDVLSSESRPRLILAVFLMGMQQLSGIDGVLYVCYSPVARTKC
jgi:hypothetical protein